MNSSTLDININSGIIKDVTIPIATLDKNLFFLSHSKNFTEEHYIDRIDYDGEYFFDVIEDFPSDFKAILENCLRGHSCEDEKRFLTKHGKIIWLKWRINPQIKDDNNVVGLEVILENITKKKATDELIKEAQEVSRTGGWQVNLLNFEVQWTEMVNIIHEMPLSYVPKTFDECFLPFKEGYYRNKVIDATNNAVQNNIPWDEEVLIITGLGNELWVRTKGKAEFIDGKCVRVYGICQDIDAYKRAQLKYRRSAELLKNAITASQVGTWEYNLANGKTVWDDVNFNLYGVEKTNNKESIYRIWKNSLHPDDINRVIKSANLFYNGKGKGVIEYRICLSDGSIRFLKSTITFVSDVKSANQKAIGITQDVTTEKIAEKKLKEFAQITSEQNNSLTNFAHMVSHDLRSHSTNLSVLIAFLEDEKDEHEKKQILKMLKKATNNLNQTVCSLNEVTQSTDSNISDRMLTINLFEAISMVQNKIFKQSKNLNWICIVDVDERQLIKIVPEYLESILINLFTNSLKYCSNSRDLIIQIKSEIKDDTMEVTFADNGKGFDIEKFNGSIFGMNKTFHRNSDARGVGLYITKNQITAMGGTIEVHSKINEGTTFTMKFKL